MLWAVATELAREVAFCLFRLQRKSENRLTGFRETWVKYIDYIAATFDAQRTPVTADLEKIGIGYGSDFSMRQLLALLGSNQEPE
jgi:hypothetical protein